MLSFSRRLGHSAYSQCQRHNSMKHEVDDCAIPVRPTWSVHELLSSYPNPTISNATLQRLHKLSALTPPEEGTKEHASLKRELEELIKLVEAVKLVDAPEVDPDASPAMTLRSDNETRPSEEKISGRRLLSHSLSTRDEYYVVKTPRPK